MKYLFFNDIKNVFKDKSLKVICITLLLEFVFQFFLFDDNLINLLLGRNFNNIRYFISTLFFLLNILLFTYVSLNVYLNDITYNVDHIFLRIKPVKFIVEKVLIILLSVFALRAFEYILLLPTIINNSYSMTSIIEYYLKDILFYYTFSLLIIFVREYKWLIRDIGVLLFIIYIVIVPKNIDNFYLTYFIIVLILILLVILSINCFVKRIIESEGGSK